MKIEKKEINNLPSSQATISGPIGKIEHKSGAAFLRKNSPLKTIIEKK